MNAIQLEEKLTAVRADWPQLVSRYERGIAIYKLNHFRFVEGDETRVMVPSQTNDRIAHIVTSDNGMTRCTCQDYAHNAPNIRGRKLCKHVIAVSLLAKNGEYAEA